MCPRPSSSAAPTWSAFPPWRAPWAKPATTSATIATPIRCSAFARRRFIEQDLERAQAAIEAHTGVRPAWFRAPFGVRWFGLGRAERRLDLTGVMWTVIGYDWNLKVEAVVERMARRVSNGAILCLHDGRELRARPDIGVTVEAVRRLVPMLLDRGYKLETVSRLLCPTN